MNGKIRAKPDGAKSDSLSREGDQRRSEYESLLKDKSEAQKRAILSERGIQYSASLHSSTNAVAAAEQAAAEAARSALGLFTVHQVIVLIADGLQGGWTEARTREQILAAIAAGKLNVYDQHAPGEPKPLKREWLDVIKAEELNALMDRWGLPFRLPEPGSAKKVRTNEPEGVRQNRRLAKLNDCGGDRVYDAESKKYKNTGRGSLKALIEWVKQNEATHKDEDTIRKDLDAAATRRDAAVKAGEDLARAERVQAHDPFVRTAHRDGKKQEPLK